MSPQTIKRDGVRIYCTYAVNSSACRSLTACSPTTNNAQFYQASASNCVIYSARWAKCKRADPIAVTSVIDDATVRCSTASPGAGKLVCSAVFAAIAPAFVATTNFAPAGYADALAPTDIHTTRGTPACTVSKLLCNTTATSSPEWCRAASKWAVLRVCANCTNSHSVSFGKIKCTKT